MPMCSHTAGQQLKQEVFEKTFLILFFNDTLFILPVAYNLPLGCLFSTLDSCEECYGVCPGSSSLNTMLAHTAWQKNINKPNMQCKVLILFKNNKNTQLA